MRALTPASVDPVMAAGIHAVVLGIFEAVIVLLLARAGTARSKFKEMCDRVSQGIYNIRYPGFYLHGERWAEYALDSQDRVRDLQLRLEEITHPGLIEREIAEGLAAVRSNFPPPDDDAARGMVLLKIVAAVWAQSPFPTAIREERGHIVNEDPRVPLNLADLGTIREWLAACEIIGFVILQLEYGREKVAALLDAAARNNYGLGSPSDHPTLEWAEKSRSKWWGELYNNAMGAFKKLVSLSAELDSELSTWESSRLSATYRRSLICGLIGGGLTFVTGVIVPLTIAHPYRFLYIYIPVVFYFLVLFSIVIFAIRETQEY